MWTAVRSTATGRRSRIPGDQWPCRMTETLGRVRKNAWWVMLMGVRAQEEAGLNRARALSIVVPTVGLALHYTCRVLLPTSWPAPVADGLMGLFMLAGVVTFSQFIFRLLDRQNAQLARQHAELAQRYETEHRLRDQLEGVQQAAIIIASASTGTEILQRLVELAPEIIPARYAALGVLSAHDSIGAFYSTSTSRV
jgi:hypothetical protein